MTNIALEKQETKMPEIEDKLTRDERLRLDCFNLAIASAQLVFRTPPTLQGLMSNAETIEKWAKQAGLLNQ